MPRCETCGAEYDHTFEIHRDGKSWTFDSFECAIAKLAPRCGHCGCRVIGHGVEEGGTVFCCQHCLDETLGVAEGRHVPVHGAH